MNLTIPYGATAGGQHIGQAAYLRGYKRERESGLCESAHLMRRRTNRTTLSESRGSLEDLRDPLDRKDHELVRLESVEADQG